MMGCERSRAFEICLRKYRRDNRAALKPGRMILVRDNHIRKRPPSTRLRGDQ